MRPRIAFRWFAVAATAAAAPKCVLCVLAYAGVGAAVFGRVELCGAPAENHHALMPWLVPAGALALGGALGVYLHLLRRKNRPAPG